MIKFKNTKKLEKIINVLFKILGIIYLSQFILFLLGSYTPNSFNLACQMLIISLVFLSAKCSFALEKIEKLEDKNKDE